MVPLNREEFEFLVEDRLRKGRLDEYQTRKELDKLYVVA